jgi:hypothetical protein
MTKRGFLHPILGETESNCADETVRLPSKGGLQEDRSVFRLKRAWGQIPELEQMPG